MIYFCIISTFILFLLIRLIYLLLIFNTWNDDLMEYQHKCYCYGEEHARFLLESKLHIGWSYFNFKKWTINDFLRDPFLIQDVNKFIKKNRLEHFSNWN